MKLAHFQVNIVDDKHIGYGCVIGAQVKVLSHDWLMLSLILINVINMINVIKLY